MTASLFVMSNSADALLVSNTDKPLEVCLSTNNKLAVLMLIDESKSLRELKDGNSKKLGNDPDDSRVPALESVVRILASAVESSQLIASDNNSSLEVAIAIAGFGDGFNERVPFKNLDSRNVEDVVTALELQRDKDSDLHTRYHTALSGSLQMFENYAKSAEVCRLLIWFSDGEHDDDNGPGFVARERDQVQKEICGSGGIVDNLRLADVNIVAAGLNSDESKLGLMQLIAQGGVGYKSVDSSGREGRVSVSVDQCGDLQPTGKYALARDADEIIDKLFEVLETIPGIPSPNDSILISPVTGVNCPVAAGTCSSIEFTVDESIASFQILAERPSSAVEVVLTTSEGQQHVALKKSQAGLPSDESAPISKNTVRTTPVTSKKVLISVNRKKENPIEGLWKLEFLGEGARASRGTVNFVGVADIQIVDSKNQVILGDDLKLGRFDAESLGIRVVSKTSGSSIRDLELKFSSFEAVASLETLRDETDDNLFLLDEKEIEQVLQTPELKKLSSTDLVVRPLGDVLGLKFSDGRPVPVNFGSRRFSVRVSNGEGMPTFVRSEGELLFEGTPTKSVTLIFRGPDSGDGEVSFIDAVEPSDAKANLDLVGAKLCKTPQQTEVACVVKLNPDKEVWQKFQVAIAVKYKGLDTAQEPIDGEVIIDVSMQKRPNPWRGILAALALLAVFLVIQGLVRWLLAFLLSRFAPLAATARRVRLDAIVDQSGALTLNPMNTNPTATDEGFAFENTESTQSFNVFGYDFSVSVLRTFMRSTVAPFGQVRSASTFVVGSRGYTRSKDESDSSTGQVSLVLRGQWIVGVEAQDVQRLINGESTVAAEVVAFLEPYESGVGISRDQQLSDLSFGISASSFATQFVALLDEERAKVEDGEDQDDLGPIEEPADINDPFVGASTIADSDPFGSDVEPQSDSETKAESKKRKRRGRGGRDEQVTSSEQNQPDESNNWDPFA